MAEYRLTPAAEHDLEYIWRYTRQEWGLKEANRYIDILEAAFAQLAELPKSAPACDHVRPGYRRRGVGVRMIYLRIADYGVAIIRILHGRADAPRHL